MKLQPGTAEEAGMSAARVRRIADLAQSWVTQGLTPALVVLVARRGIVVLHEAFGRLTSAADAPPLPREALYPLASLSKPVTATAAMILVEDGLLGLNRPVCEYIPEFAANGKETVMVHHLLTHTSGLREAEVNRHIDEKILAGVSIPPPAAIQHPKVHELLYLGYDTPLWKAPGVEMSYCSYGYDLLGEIVQRVSGQPLAEFARERIFAPLEMHDSWYSVPAAVRHRIVRRPPTALLAGPQSPSWEGLSVYPLRGPKVAWFPGLDSREWEELPSGAGGVYSTALDMARFGQMFLNRGRYGERRFLSPSAVEMMTTNQIPGISAIFNNEFFPEAGWGFGWEVRSNKQAMYEGTLCSPLTFSHGGGGGVYLWVDPVNELVGVYFSVVLRTTATGQQAWPVDLFMNAVTAAVSDG